MVYTSLILVAIGLGPGSMLVRWSLPCEVSVTELGSTTLAVFLKCSWHSESNSAGTSTPIKVLSSSAVEVHQALRLMSQNHPIAALHVIPFTFTS